MIPNDVDLTRKGNDPDDHLENSKDCCGCGAVVIFQGLVGLHWRVADVDNVLRFAGLVLLLHCEVSLFNSPPPEDLLFENDALFGLFCAICGVRS